MFRVLSFLFLFTLLLLCFRVPDNLPLYDILNEFQKGHSHMAVVIKQASDMSSTVEKVNVNISETRTMRIQRQADGIFPNIFPSVVFNN